LNEYFCRPFNNEKLLLKMGEFEGRVSGSVHYDNVAPAFLGGLQLMVLNANRVCAPVPFFKEWFWVVAYPGISLSTAHMRALLPEKFDRATTIEYGRNLGVFIQASFCLDQQLAVSVLKDVLAEPWRCNSIPGFSRARTAMCDLGMLATGISGSGPTVFSVTDNPDRAEQARKWLENNFMQSKEGFTRVCRIDHKGARLL
ncbi:MAG TPA: homoserine kinase, partial [Candidatus Rifleibacterium sp.]|nr:homoserine kinase [Candidatus Rifleibacterium sp.]